MRIPLLRRPPTRDGRTVRARTRAFVVAAVAASAATLLMAWVVQDLATRTAEQGAAAADRTAHGAPATVDTTPGDAEPDDQVPGESDSAVEVEVVGNVGRTESLPTVVLERRKGSVVGDGKTLYVANGTTFLPRRGRVALPPRLRGRSWVVVDLDSGDILGQHRPRLRLPQASTIKLLTALTAVRTAAAQHTVTRFEARQTCSCAGLERGRRYTRSTLLAGALLASGNDAAEALAGSHPEGRLAFYAAMNQLARELGATDTVARNASGLTAPGSHSSARDLVLLLRAALADPDVAPYLSMTSARIATVEGRHPHTVWQETRYVARYDSSAGKSGYTTPAKNTLVVATTIKGRRIAVASMGVPSGYSTEGARALTLWASRSAPGLRAVGQLPGS